MSQFETANNIIKSLEDGKGSEIQKNLELKNEFDVLKKLIRTLGLPENENKKNQQILEAIKKSLNDNYENYLAPNNERQLLTYITKTIYYINQKKDVPTPAAKPNNDEMGKGYQSILENISKKRSEQK